MISLLLIYSAIFTPNKDNNTCSVSFPDLNYSCLLDYSDKETFRKQLQDELGFALWLLEDSGKLIPTPKTISKNSLPAGSFIDFVQCDYFKFKKTISVKVFDLSV